jgi:MFS family permease
VTESARYKWYVVAMLWFVFLFNYADRQAIFSVFPLLKTQLQLSDLQLSYIASSFMWVYAVCGPLAGLVGDRFQRKTVILSGLLFWSVVTLATALASTYTQLVALRALEGLGEAFYLPASMALISAYHSPQTRSRAMAWHQSSVYAGTVVGGTVAGFAADRFGWRSGFVFFGSLGILLGFVLILALREPPRRSQEMQRNAFNIGDALQSISASRMALVLIAVFVGANFVAMIFLTWLPSYLHQTFNMTLTMAGLDATLYLQAASVLGVLSGGVLADRLSQRHRAGRALTQAMGLFAGVPFLLFTGGAATVSGFVIAISGFGLFKGIYDSNIWAALHDVVPVHRRATAVGFMNSIGWLGGGAAPVVIAAAARRFGMSVCLSMTAVIYAALGLLLVIAIHRTTWQPAQIAARG